MRSLRAVEAVAGRTPIIVGIGTLRTSWTQALARDAEMRGADALLLAPVSYNPPTEDELFEHYEAVAKETALPICVYNNPGTTHVVFAEDLISRLSRVTRIAALKMPLPQDGNFDGELARLRAITAEDFQVGYSGDWGAAPALLAGADAFYSGIGGVLPKPMMALARAAQGGDTDRTHALNLAFQPLWSLCRAYGGLRVCYAISHLLGLETGEPPRPLRPLPHPVQDEVAQALDHIQSYQP